MRCDEFENLWNDALDRRESPSRNSALVAHAAHCPCCAELLAGGRMLETAFTTPPRNTANPRNSTPTMINAGFTDRVLSAVLADRARPQIERPREPFLTAEAVESPANRQTPRSRSWLYWTGGIVAAGLLLTVIVRNRPANQDPEVPTVGPQQVAVDPLLGAPNTARQPVIAQDSKSVPPDVATENFALPDAMVLAAATPRFDRSQLSWVGYRMADGITPVTSGVSNALESLKRPLNKQGDEMPIPAPLENGRSSGMDIVLPQWV